MMDFSAIEGFNTNYNLNAVREYNNFLQGQAAFDFDAESTDFARALDSATKSIPLKDKFDSVGAGSLMEQMGQSFGGALNAVNRAKLDAEKLQEDLAMGGSTSVHDAMIAAEKAELSMQMAVQVRNRIISAYTEINSMAL